jgi:hypothetical protein
VVYIPLVADPPRLLHRRSEFAYTDHPTRALAGEPEAVDQQTQARLTAEAARGAEARRRSLWRDVRGRLLGDLELLRSEFGPSVAQELRGIRREVDRLGGKLGRLA